ncbi:MAG: SDR family NAD(P)-dependent oxidoreductase [Anaerolineae bacterium]|nr:MAG: SDR family NAD(P)-dependent oxidoreductase [Anaerolineae bacterium]
MKTYLVTGGTGFLGAALVRRLVQEGHVVRVLDNNSRGAVRKLGDAIQHVELIEGDIRDAATVSKATKGVDSVCHLAFINGTAFFYSKPELVLDVGVKGMVNVIDACHEHNVGELVVASSSEVYHHPPIIPTPENVPLVIPDPHNPRYSYASGKLISEIMAINYGRKFFERVIIFRPHNVYGPDMGYEHVIPQFVVRMQAAVEKSDANPLPFPIQGTGHETRAFVYIDDFTDGLMLALEKGEHLGIYHIGTQVETSIADIARLVGKFFGRDIDIVAGELQKGGTPRRCPDITKLKNLGYQPKISLQEGITKTAQWYVENRI